MGLSLKFEDAMKTLGIERKSDGKLYYSNGQVCDMSRALSTPGCIVKGYSLENITSEHYLPIKS